MNKFIYYILLSFTLLGYTEAYAQSGDFVIQDISFSGIVKNDESYLRQFLSSEKGKLLKGGNIDKDLQQLRRRNGVSDAQASTDTVFERGLVNLTFHITEQRTLLPVLGVGGIKNNFWFQIGVEEYNLFGKEQGIFAQYLHSDNLPNYKIYYQNARRTGSVWGYAADLNHSASVEPLYFSTSIVEYQYTNTGIGSTLFRNFGFNHRISSGVTLFRETYQKNNAADVGFSEGPDRLTQNKILFKASYEVNYLQYDLFYRQGSFRQTIFESVLTLDDKTTFYSLSYEERRYWRPFQKTNIAFRLRAAIATNRPSPFAPFVLDSRVNIRGVGNRVDRGTAQLLFNLEYRQTVFHTGQWAGQLVLFSDAGTWRNPGGKLKDIFDSDVFRQFLGGGIRIINNRVFKLTMRLDYGIDIWNTGEKGFVFGVGQYF